MNEIIDKGLSNFLIKKNRILVSRDSNNQLVIVSIEMLLS